MITRWNARALCAAAGALILATTTTADTYFTPTDVHQTAGPTIRPTQREMILQSGENFTLYCSGTSQIQFKHQDITEEITSDFYTEQRIVKDNESGYEVALDLVNVDRFAVGYYACFDGSVDASGVLANVVEEPHDTLHISYIYIYVNGTISMFAPMRALVIPEPNSTFIIECRPTSPDIKVSLTVDFADVKYEHYSPKVGFTVGSDVPSDALTSALMCVFEQQGDIVYKDVIVYKHKIVPPPIPEVFGGSKYFLKGETFSINCTVERQRNSPVELVWKIPGPAEKVLNFSNEFSLRDDYPILYNNYTIRNAGQEDEGLYTCISKNSIENKTASFMKKYLETPILKMDKSNTIPQIIKTLNETLRVAVYVDAYPPAEFVFLKDNGTLPKSKVRVSSSITGETKIYLTVRRMMVNDTGNYTVKATNQHVTNTSTFDIRVLAAPVVSLGPVKKYLLNTRSSLICEAIGYPLSTIEWIFSTKDGEQVINSAYQRDTIKSLYQIESILEIPVRVPGNITCRASNGIDGSSAVRNDFIVYEIEDGFGIIKDQTWFPEDQDVELKCLASVFDFLNASWYGTDFEEMNNVEYTENALSYIAKLKLNRISVSQAGTYTCMGLSLDGIEEHNDTISITIAENRAPIIEDIIYDGKSEEIFPFQPVNFTCTADAVPPPIIEWFKDGKPLQNDTNVQVLNNNIDQSTRYSVIKIFQMQEDDAGKYECRVTSRGVTNSKFYNLLMKEKATYKKTYLSIIGAIILVLIIIVVYLAWKIRKEKEFRKELAAAGLLNFKEGAIKSINPDIGIDEQAELLPYDEKFEFPPECLKLGKQLGAGAFGVVYKAEARGIIDAETTTTVAVKMVKKTADNMYIKALAMELKIMVHLGKHINIVNLLGACTKNVGKRELIVIVEYCKFGNIHNYMQKHRDVFIDQFSDNPEKPMGKINRGYSSSSANSGMHSDYYGSNHSQNTDHTMLNTMNTNRSSRKHSETGYVQPEWRSNYESDYSFDGRSPRPLYTRDLLAWAFQIARGMEYLASRKVLHGDLAARNILLADDNIVKICDFGLARSIYKNDEYQKQENSPLPVKWLAIECMTDRIFSTQSDVWSFGIVLWELFSLAKTPYPNVSPPSLLQWLLQGGRLEKPPYADDRIYELMKSCWEQKPIKRPSFTELQTTLGTFLEDNVRNHYVDLDAVYMDMNTKKVGEEDYLAMVTAPDYNNLVTPSPHHYVNDARSFFPPTPSQIPEDEGYLQMSPASRQIIFNARPHGTKFDFDARKLTPRVSEANSYGSESTPMLTLNNLPRSGSESDQEGHSPPSLNACPRIDEEIDEVFEIHLNHKNMQPISVTNPTYITMSADNEKKSQNFTNNYINVNITNGLVK